jgi:hypothetical protein
MSLVPVSLPFSFPSYLVFIQYFGVTSKSHGNSYISWKIMKYVPKLKLGFSLSWQTLVAPVHDSLLGLMASFLRIKLRLLVI